MVYIAGPWSGDETILVYIYIYILNTTNNFASYLVTYLWIFELLVATSGFSRGVTSSHGVRNLPVATRRGLFNFQFWFGFSCSIIMGSTRFAQVLSLCQTSSAACFLLYDFERGLPVCFRT